MEKSQMKLTLKEFEKKWKIIKKIALDELEKKLDGDLKTSFSPNDFMTAYTICYNICTSKENLDSNMEETFSSILYKRHGQELKRYLTKKLMRIRDIINENSPNLLEEFSHELEKYKIMNRWYKKFFMYLDRFHTKMDEDRHSLYEKGKRILKNTFYKPIWPNISSFILKKIHEEREGQVVNQVLLKSVINTIIELGSLKDSDKTLYVENIEEPFLVETQKYYNIKCQSLSSLLDSVSYMREIRKFLDNEEERIKNYMDENTRKKVMTICYREMIFNYSKSIQLDAKILLDQDKLNDLGLMYELLNKVELTNELAFLFGTHIRELGMMVLKYRKQLIDTKKDKVSNTEYVDKLMEIYNKYIPIIKKYFKNDSVFQKSFHASFESIMNKNIPGQVITNAEIMVYYCDRILKANSTDLNDEDSEKLLMNILDLFMYLSDKDLFGEIYRKMMSNRLLNNRCKNMDLEKIVIGKLKIKCGSNFTRPFEGMIVDMNNNLSRMSDFKKYLGTMGIELDIGFDARVLTTGFWPTYTKIDIPMPLEFQKSIDAFHKFYESKTNHRTLNWISRLGTSIVRFNIKKKWYDLQMTTLQAIVLALFSDPSGPESQSFSDISNKLDMQGEPEILKKLLHSFTCVKHKILEKEPKNKVISDTDVFRVNQKFKCQQKKIRLPMASLDTISNTKFINENRGLTVDAIIVRIMKSRKVLGHNDLVSDTMTQIALFKTNAKFIKNRINRLIDREYLERNPDDMNKYHYLA